MKSKKSTSKSKTKSSKNIYIKKMEDEDIKLTMKESKESQESKELTKEYVKKQ